MKAFSLHFHAVPFVAVLVVSVLLPSSAKADLSVFAEWNSDPTFEMTLFKENDHCPSPFKAVVYGRKVDPYLLLGCWRMSSDGKYFEVTATHEMDKKTKKISDTKRYSQGLPISSFKIKK